MAGTSAAFSGDMQSGANCARGIRLEDHVTREEAAQGRWAAGCPRSSNTSPRCSVGKQEARP